MLINKQIPEDTIEGYTPAAAEPAQASERAQAAAPSRFHKTAPEPQTSDDAADTPPSPEAKRLGARFKPRRRRRR